MQMGVVMQPKQGNFLVAIAASALFWALIGAGVYIVRYTR